MTWFAKRQQTIRTNRKQKPLDRKTLLLSSLALFLVPTASCYLQRTRAFLDPHSHQSSIQHTTTILSKLSAYRYNPYMYEEPGSNIGRTWDDDYSRTRRLRPYVGNNYYNSYDADYEMYNGYRSLRPDRKLLFFDTPHDPTTQVVVVAAAVVHFSHLFHLLPTFSLQQNLVTKA